VTVKADTRMLILDTADQIIIQQGVGALSFDTLAKQAQISRGGILYHFPSKEALISGMLDRLIDKFERILDEEMAADAEEYGRFTRAFARATFRTDQESSAIFAALIAAIAYDPGLAAPMRSRWESWQQRAESELGKPKAAVVRMASQALWLNGIFELNHYTPEEQTEIVAELEKLTRP
jgi:AcrR family transcriptional regulator